MSNSGENEEDLTAPIEKMTEKEFEEIREKDYKYDNDLAWVKSFKLWGEIAAHVQMHTAVELSDNGQLVVETRFSNGDPNSGHGMCVTTYLQDASGKNVYIVFQYVYFILTGGKWDGTQEDFRETKAQLSAEQTDRIVSATSTYTGLSLAAIDAAQAEAEKAKKAIGQTN